MFHHQAVIGVQSFKRNHQVIVCIFQQCIALIFWVHVLQLLWSIIYCSSHHCLRSITTQEWCLWVLRSAGERDRHPGCTLSTLTNLEPNTQCTRLPMQSTGNCALVVWRGALPIEILTDRQTGWKVRYLCQSRSKWQQSVLSNELYCVCCAQWKFTLNQLTDRIKLLLVVPQMKVNNLERNIQCTSLSLNYISHIFLGPMVDFWARYNNLIS